MSRWASILVVLAFGCATPLDLVNRPDAVELTTSRPATEVVDSITTEWLKHRPDVVVTPAGGGQILTVMNSMSVKVWSESGATHIRYRKRPGVVLSDWVEEAIKNAK